MRLFLPLLMVFAITTGSYSEDGILRSVLFEPWNIPNLIKNKIADVKVSFDAQLMKLNVFEGAGLGLRYKYQFEPSYKQGYYTRVDRWKLNVSLAPGDVIADSLNLPIWFGVDNEQEILFVRHFKSNKKAHFALPYQIKQLPVTAERALKYLQPGDFVSIPARMNIVVKARTPGLPVNIANASIGTHYMLSGLFTVQVLRIRDNQVRVRLVAENKREWGVVDGEAGFNFKIWTLNLFKHEIDLCTKITLADFGFKRESGDMYVLDYQFNLNEPEAKEAYNRILSSGMKLKHLKMINPITAGNEDRNFAIADTEMADELYFKEMNHREGKPLKVRRIFKGFSKYKSKSSRFNVSLGFFTYKSSSSYTESVVKYSKGKLSPLTYLYTNKANAKNTGNMIKGNRKMLRSAAGLFLMDRKRRIRGIKDFSFGTYIKDDEFRTNEQVEVRDYITANIGEKLASKIDWSAFITAKPRMKSRMDFQVFFHRKVFHLLMNISEEKLLEEFEQYALKQGFEYNWFSHSKKKVIAMLHQIFEVFDENSEELSVRDRIKKSMEIRSNKLFNELGLGFIFHLLRDQPMDDLVYVFLHEHALHTPVFEFEFGNVKKSHLYKQLQYTQAMMNERTLEMQSDVLEKEMADELGKTDGETEVGASEASSQKRIFNMLYN